MKNLIKFYTKSWFYTVLLIVSLVVTISPWFTESDDFGIWLIRIAFIAIWVLMNVLAWFLVENSKNPEDEVLD